MSATTMRGFDLSFLTSASLAMLVSHHGGSFLPGGQGGGPTGELMAFKLP